MDGELVTASSSSDDASVPRTPAQTFRDEFPRYLAMGMTTEEYWDGDAELTRFYRKADEIRNEKINQELWLQGLYVYEAISDIAPILHAFAKKGAKAKPYLKEPFPLSVKEMKRKEDAKNKAVYKKGQKYLEALAAASHKKTEDK